MSNTGSAHNFKWAVLALAIAGSLNNVHAAPVGNAEKPAISFNIPGQKLIPALSAFAEQSGLQLLYSAELAEGKSAPALSGKFTTEQGLAQLLNGSGLSFRFVESGVVTIEKQAAQAASKPLAKTGSAGSEATLSETVVTANPVIESINLDAFSNSSATVTEDQIRDQNALDIASALRRTPGVQISRYNPVGAFGGDQGGAVSIRGQGMGRPGSEIKTYIDDVPMYMATWNHPLLDLLPVNGMQSITVYKGPQPHINGNNFGSINLETKTATEEGVHGSGRLSGGFFGTITEQVDVQGKKGDLDYSLAQGYSKSDGNRKNGFGELRNVMGKVGYQFDSHWRSDVSFLYADNRAGDPGQTGYRPVMPWDADLSESIGEYDSIAGMVAASVSHDHGRSKGKFTVFHNGGDGNWLKQGVYFAGEGNKRSDLKSQYSMDGFRWKEQFSPWQGGTVTTGIDSEWQNGTVKNWTPSKSLVYSITTPAFRLTTPYVAYNHDIVLSKDWTMVPSVGVRYYGHSHYQSKASPHAGLSFISKDLTLFGNVSNGVNYPGIDVVANSGALMNAHPESWINSSYVPLGFAPFSADGWKNISPENVDHAEVGLKASPFDTTKVDLSFFIDNVKNRYVFNFMQGSYTNYGNYWMRGFEASVKQDLIADWTMFASLTMLNPTIDNLPYTPAQTVNAGINGPVGPLRVSFDMQYQSRVWALNRSRNQFDVNSQQVDAFTVANARVAYPMPQLGKKGEVFVSVENLFDKHYQYRPGYEMPGIWGQVGVAASF